MNKIRNKLKKVVFMVLLSGLLIPGLMNHPNEMSATSLDKTNESILKTIGQPLKYIMLFISRMV